jgi:hypothetical protein
MSEGIRPIGFDIEQRRLSLGLEAAHNLNHLIDSFAVPYSQVQSYRELGALAPEVAEFMTECEEVAGRFLGHSATNDTLFNDGSNSNLKTLEPWTEAGETALKADQQLEVEQANVATLQEYFHAITEPVATGFRDKLPETRQKRWGRSERSGTSNWAATNQLRGVTHNYSLDYTYGADDAPHATELRCKTEKTTGHPVEARATLGSDGRVNVISVGWSPESNDVQEKLAIAAMGSDLTERLTTFDRFISIDAGSEVTPPQIHLSSNWKHDNGRTYTFHPSQNIYVDETGRPKYSPEDAADILQEMLKLLPTVAQPGPEQAI